MIMSDHTSPRVIVPLRENWCCLRCGQWCKDRPHSLHHRRLRSALGHDSVPNLILLCGSGTTGCHGFVHANPALSAQHGYLLSRYSADSAETVPVKSWMWGYIYLLPDATVRLETEAEQRLRESYAC